VAQGGQNGAPNAGPMYRGARDRSTVLVASDSMPIQLCQNRNHIHIVQTKVGILSPSREHPDSTGVSDI
jgi:hypothetical protein